MVSNRQLANLSDDVYSLAANPVKFAEQNGAYIEWQRNKQYDYNGMMGFACGLYNRLLRYYCVADADEWAVLAFRGTSDLYDALIDDVQIATLGVPPQAYAAISVATEAKKVYPNLILTGHSLGGALAIIAGAHTDLKVVTFNAPGVAAACIQTSYLKLTSGQNRWNNFMKTVQACAAGANVENIRIGYDLVSTNLLPQVGNKTVLKSICGTFDVMCKHQIKTIINSLDN